jgi:peptide-methionine (S)-S-oxide reductase
MTGNILKKSAVLGSAAFLALSLAAYIHSLESRVTEKAMFAAGCFWGVEDTFRAVPGVVDALVGYSGGTKENPTYEDVCRHNTGHAEVVEVEFDPSKVSYQKLLEVFFANHNPTTLNRQGPDVGDQYRSHIFYYSPEQKAQAEAYRDKLNKERFKGKIVTLIDPAKKFWKAEEYHQQYLKKHGLGNCHV